MTRDAARSFRLPPLPWARFEDAEPLGFSVSIRAWLQWLFPYRTAEYLGYDRETRNLKLGEWRWHPPEAWSQLRERDTC